MRLLVDTHILLWVAAGSSRLDASARRRLESAQAVYFSAASIWEVAIKARLGKIEADAARLALLASQNGFDELPVRAAHAAAVAALPLHHHDPFDRLLIAQAVSEPLHFMTADEQLGFYSELVILV